MAQAARRKKRGRTRRGHGGTGHAWGMLLVGLVCGAVLSGLYFGYQENQPGRFGSGIATLLEDNGEPEQTVENSEPAAAGQSEEPESTIDLDYEYYKRLPRIDDLIASSDFLGEEAPVEDRPKHLYILQAGAYKNERDAESIKARLALAGFESVIQRTVNDDQTYYRVRLGPYESRRTLERHRKRLADEGIEALALRLEPPAEQARQTD